MNSTTPHKPTVGRLVTISSKAHDSLLQMATESAGKKPRIVLAGYG